MNGNMNCSSTTWLVLPLGSWEGAQDKLYTIEAALSNWQVLALNHLLELTTTKEIQIAIGSTITALSNGLMYSQYSQFDIICLRTKCLFSCLNEITKIKL